MICLTAEFLNGRDRKIALFLNGESWKEVSARIFSLKALSLLREFSDKEAFKQCWEDHEYKAVKSFALKSLARRSLSTPKLKKTLLTCLVDELLIGKIIAEFQEKGWLDDTDWLGVFIRKEARQLASPRGIMEKLKNQGFSYNSILGALKIHYSEALKMSILQKLIEKKQKKADFSRQKVIGSLIRKGFQLPDIFRALALEGGDGI